MRWVKESPEILLKGEWVALRSIDGHSLPSIVVFAKKKFRGKWQRRIGEDLVEVLSEMGHPPGKTVTLGIANLQGGDARVLRDVPMTAENRAAIIRLKVAKESRARRQTRPGTIETVDLLGALKDFESSVDNRWSYRRARNTGIDAAIASLRTKTKAGLTPDEFGLELQKIIARGIDGHAGVRGYRITSAAKLPFLVEPSGQRFVAFRANRGALLDSNYPYVAKIDGKPIADWCEAAAPFIANGSPQYVRRHGLRWLRDLGFMRRAMKLPEKAAVEVELRSRDGKDSRVLEIPVANRTPTYGVWPRASSRILPGKVGYLRLPQMNRKAVEEIQNWMPKFKDSVGLVVDVRDNGGGLRDALRTLYSYLVPRQAKPRVFNAAAYRLHAQHARSHLEARFMYRAKASQWTSAERRAIARFAKRFKPEWQLPKGQFSKWHYMVLSPLEVTGLYHYKKPIIVLMNAKCFSATDIFLAGLKGVKGITLLGTASGGGSARSQTVRLGRTHFQLRIGSMASFQADGKLFDGHGVQPDVVLDAEPDYFIGGRDNQLAEAVRRISGR